MSGGGAILPPPAISFRTERPMITLDAPDSHCCVGFEGSQYEVRDGQVDVPEHAEGPLHCHGYRRPKVEYETPAPPAPRKRR
jgi:hypothetical protein